MPTIGALIAARACRDRRGGPRACSLALLNYTYPEPGERARAVGLWTSGGAAALAAGPLAGGC